ncbi:general secretion pathway protein GspM [Mesorhizobium sp. M00.F.Ca.ET.186.01.1.1]|nr:general secretion pathway protein GspM [bacterium M00.F.Ca.ET.205.01.1.1]TGU53771.1 general secretion pathway protein GspM [bacterium M00.F.Ca.ET.152.01.1.1]TGV37269.1 general secretion pathway protein GspM [Mesorhizobium sp. M00.F.Ca.ET.186.01.1.1]TGZ39360.1 general secretion pathway protein GspM [bacterium M00.F.Ca.ET.162.01.1.1]TIW61227.1 MAG: general secretion pathway protein GspM [Mesorhizobium sp.]
MLTAILNSRLLLRRSLAVAIAGLCALLAGWLLFAALGSVASARSDIDDKRATLGQIDAVVALAKTMEASAPPPAASGRGEFLSGDSEAIIRGGLQTRLNAIATSNKVVVLSAGNAPALNENGVAYLGLRANVSGTLEGVHGFMLSLETTLPVLFIRETTLRVTNVAPSEAPNVEPEIFAEVLFYGALPSGIAAAPGATP